MLAQSVGVDCFCRISSFEHVRGVVVRRSCCDPCALSVFPRLPGYALFVSRFHLHCVYIVCRFV